GREFEVPDDLRSIGKARSCDQRAEPREDIGPGADIFQDIGVGCRLALVEAERRPADLPKMPEAALDERGAEQQILRGPPAHIERAERRANNEVAKYFRVHRLSSSPVEAQKKRPSGAS